MPAFKTILAIDSAMNGCGAGVWSDGGKISVGRSMPMERGQAEELMPLVQRVMAEAKIAYEQLDAVVATVGPGTFTGLRVGLSAAKGVALARGIPIVGVTTLEVLAEMCAQKPCAILIETKREDFYFQSFDAKGPTSEAAGLPASEIAKRLAGKDITLAGDCLARFRGQEPGAVRSAVDLMLPDPVVMCRMAAEGRGIAPEPVYLRAPDTTIAKNPPRRLAGMASDGQ